MTDLDHDPIRWLLRRGLVSPARVEECRRTLPESAGASRLLRLLVHRGFVDPVEIAALGSRALRKPIPATSPDAPTVRTPRDELPRPIGAEPACAPIRAQGSPVRRHIAHFEIHEELGRGGMGVVYRAWDTRLQRVVALKVLEELAGADENASLRFQREARTAARLKHPAIVQVHDVGLHDGVAYIAMDYIAGTTLRSRLQGARCAVDFRGVAGLAKQVAEALAYAHAAGVVHRDVKPENVLLDRSGRPYVGDFGLARELGARSRMTVSGIVLGTPSYMSPEQAEGRASIGPQADVYGLGTLLYEMLTGRPPHVGKGLLQTLYEVLHRDVTPPTGRNPRVPRDLELICMKCLEREPSRRYPTALELAQDLGRFLDGEAILARPPSNAYRLRRWAGRRRGVLGAAAALLVAGAVAGWFGLQAHRAARDRDRSVLASESYRRAQVAVAEAIARQRLGDASSWKRVLDRVRAASQGDADLGARVVLGWVLRLDGNAVEAETALSEAIRVRPEDPFARYQRGLARAQAYGEAVRDARRRWSGIAGSSPEEKDLVLLRPDLPALRAGAVDDFLAVERSASAGRGPELSEGMLECGRGLLCLYRGELDEADALLTAALGLDPFRDEAHDGRIALAEARLLSARAAFEPLLTAYDGAIAANRGRWRLWVGRGETRFWKAVTLAEGGRREEAEAIWADAESDAQTAIALESERPEPWNLEIYLLCQRAHAKTRRGLDGRADLARAIEIGDDVLRRFPESAEVHNNRGLAHLALGSAEAASGSDPKESYRRALSDFEAAAKRLPDVAQAWNNAGMAYLELGKAAAARGGDGRPQFRAAMARFEEAFRRFEGFTDAHHSRGLAWMAIAEAESARGEDPSASYEHAIGAFGWAIETHREYARGYDSRGLAHAALAAREEALGRDPRPGLRRAIADHDLALEIDGGFLEGYNNRANAHASLARAETARGGDPDTCLDHALDDLARVAAGNPSDPAVHNNRGGVLLQRGEHESAGGRDPRPTYRQAVEAFDRGLDLHPGSPVLLMNRGNACQVLGNAEAAWGGEGREWHERALADYATALEENPALWQAHANRGLLLESMERPAEAVRSFEAALALVKGGYPALETWLARARNAADRGEVR